jgi:DDE superfamily endonuclease
MDVQASPDELPELNEFLGSFQGRFRCPEGADALERYTTGLLTELPTKHGDTIALAVPGTSEQRLQEVLTTMPRTEEDLHRQREAQLIAEATPGDGVLVLDATGCPKHGTAPAGVARQYSGTRGKVGNCQVAVPCCYPDPQASGPVAVRWYLPRDWADAAGDPSGGRPMAPPPSGPVVGDNRSIHGTLLTKVLSEQYYESRLILGLPMPCCRRLQYNIRAAADLRAATPRQGSNGIKNLGRRRPSDQAEPRPLLRPRRSGRLPHLDIGESAHGARTSPAKISAKPLRAAVCKSVYC